MTLDVQAGDGGLLGYLWITISCLQVALETMGFGVCVWGDVCVKWEWEVVCVGGAPSLPSISSFLLKNILESPAHQPHGSLT